MRAWKDKLDRQLQYHCCGWSLVCLVDTYLHTLKMDCGPVSTWICDRHDKLIEGWK